jgi:hypothetical protein
MADPFPGTDPNIAPPRHVRTTTGPNLNEEETKSSSSDPGIQSVTIPYKKPKAGPAQSTQTQSTELESAIQKYLGPEESEVNTLPSEYSSVMGQIGATQVPSTGNAQLDAADQAVTQSLEAGEPAIQQALGNIGTAVKGQISSIPYQDVLATTLQAKKNEILYGTLPTGIKPEETGWSQNLKQIYDYLTTSSVAGNQSQAAQSGLGGDVLPSPSTASGQAPNTNTGEQTALGI